MWNNEEASWSLHNKCVNKFETGDLVVSRGDMGGYKLIIWEVKNEYYCTCRERGLLGIFKAKRFFNMNCLIKE